MKQISFFFYFEKLLQRAKEPHLIIMASEIMHIIMESKFSFAGLDLASKQLLHLFLFSIAA